MAAFISLFSKLKPTFLDENLIMNSLRVKEYSTALHSEKRNTFN